MANAPRSRAEAKSLEAWLRGFTRTVRLPLTATIITGAIGGVLLVLQAWLLARIIDGVIIEHQALQQVWPLLIDLLATFIARAIITALTDIIGFEAAARVKRAIRRQAYAHLTALGPAWSRHERSGDLATTLIDGIEALDQYYARYLPQMALAVFIPLAILVFVFPAYWIAGIIMVITAPLIPLFMIIVGKGAERLNQRQWRKLARMSAYFFDAIEGLTTLKLFGASRAEAQMIADVSDDYRITTMAVLRVAFLSSLVLEFFATISIAMVAVYIGFALYYRELHFLPGFFVLLLAPEFYRPLRNMGSSYHARMEAIGAAEQIVRLLATEAPTPDAPKTEAAPEPALTLRFEQVDFAYQPGEPILTGIDFTLAPGERLALVGPSGAGKTTISQLLLGFLEPSRGIIRIGGTDLRDLPPAAWLARIAWLPQRPTLFHGSVIDNIRLGLTADAAAVRAAAAQAGADHFITNLPQGYDTIVGERGQGLSGGEIQRIALARAFLKNAELIVLDEPDASLDPATAALIGASIERLARDRTMLIIAHRLESVRHADRILVIDHGRIVEFGDHASLIARRGLYATMSALRQDVPA
ncbi:thiol reductant ABC exporter subunit CydD [Acidiphilium sp. PA]|uniref:thiol reductant ABC exporter subunit CydD n=1 Tax=Acidiphilium sp. PA TaxID=2871705 RepID=UPI002244C401|nr:thiol reductant ABC exporter subunit CydD [Acidiphilium sp. PA]MCW8306769.1 thiol reductant ABC exporter subunit CydD [Acidiphilium sp. PA]